MRIITTLCITGFALLYAQPEPQSAPPTSPAPLNVYDGFETPTLSPLWETSRLELSSICMESQVVRAGHHAIAITIHPHDQFEAGQHGSLDSERDELLEARRLTGRQDLPYEYSFSMFFPPDFPIVPVRVVIAQWKEYCPGDNGPCSDDSPALALRYISGKLLLTQDLDRKFIVLWSQTGEFRNRWLDFRIRARFQPDNRGHIQFWFNDQRLLDYTGLTLNHPSPSSGYPDRAYVYFKMGLYRDVMPQTMTVYIDEYRKRQLTDNEF